MFKTKIQHCQQYIFNKFTQSKLKNHKCQTILFNHFENGVKKMLHQKQAFFKYL